MSASLNTSSKEVRHEIKRLGKAGWKYTHVHAGHPVIEHPQFGRLELPASPSHHRWRKNLRANVARAMGITAHELSKLIYGQRVEKTSKPKRETAPRKSQAPKLRVVRERKPPLSLEDRIDETASARTKARGAGDAEQVRKLTMKLDRLYADKRLRNGRAAA